MFFKKKNCLVYLTYNTTKVNFKIYGVTTWLTNDCKNMLPYISRSKGNQTMKFGQLIEYNKIIFFFNNHAENEAVKLVPVLFFFFQKILYEVKASDP